MQVDLTGSSYNTDQAVAIIQAITPLMPPLEKQLTRSISLASLKASIGLHPRAMANGMVNWNADASSSRDVILISTLSFKTSRYLQVHSIAYNVAKTVIKVS